MERPKKYFAGKVPHKKVDQTKQTTKEVKILNTELNKLQGTDVNTLVLNVLTAAKAFKSALKNFRIHNYESNQLQNKEIIKELADIQNMIKLKILSLKKNQINDIKGEESLKTINTQCSTQSSKESLLNFHSELSGEMLSSAEYSRNNSVDSESEALSTSKLTSLSTQSLCSTKSYQNDYLDDDDDDDDDGDDEKFKKFLVNVNCPYCLKLEDNKNSLAKHLDRDCTNFKSRTFVKSLDCPYSVFQILPNNTFKCNICPNSVQSNVKKYFTHSQSETHVSMYNKAASSKNYTELLFCASCKIQIPNNATQIMFHVEHEVHQRNRKEQRSTLFYRQRGIVCIYGKEKKFKCLSCPPAEAIHKSVKEILLHFQSKAHMLRGLSQKSQSQNLPELFCMFCLEEVNVFNVLGHFNSSSHAQKEEEENNNQFELCFYCGFKCSNLIKLARHMEDCRALDLIRQEDKHQDSEKFDRVLTQIEKDQKRPTNETTSEKGRCIIVKDYTKILELYHYFNKFGEVLEIEPSGENAVMIKFQEEKTVDHILESGRDIEINGVKPKITRKEDLDSTDKILESSRAAENVNSRPVASSLASPNVIGSNNSMVHEDFCKVAEDGGTLESLFNRVSYHLSYTAVKADCEDFLNIALDCEKILKFGKCHSVGFLKCGLTFPVEKITLYHELSDSLIKEQCLDHNSTSLTESVLFNENMCKKCINLFKNSDVFSEVSLREKSVPFVEFYHNKTNKLCTITFRQSDNVLADELRYCLQNNSKLRSFVLIIRFWLSVQKLEIREYESVIISLLLFFLLSSGVVEKSSENFKRKLGHESLHIECSLHRTIQGCKARYQKIQNENSVVEMFQNFLLFLNQFDFENMAICLPLAYPVPKPVILRERVKKHLCKWFNPNSPVWIMDPFLFNNFAVDVKKSDWDSLLKTVRETIEHYHIDRVVLTQNALKNKECSKAM